ncbi:MAG: Uma2 family endonuclease [Candidatus Desantisbacteria bacterium]
MSNALAVDLREDIWTYEDYLTLPNDGKTYQVIGGDLFMTAAPLIYHQAISRNLAFIIWEFVKDHDMGEVFNSPVDIVFGSTNVVQPDIVYVSKKRLDIIREKAIFGAPDLVIEILSPTTLQMDVLLKKALYQRFGVREYWIVDPKEQKVEVFVMEGGKYESKGIFFQQDVVEVRMIQGLKVNLTDVF